MNSYHAHHARPPTIATTMTVKGREIRAVAGATVAATDEALTGSPDGAVTGAAPWATRPNFTNSQTPTPNPMRAPRGPMLKKAPIATPPSRSGPANAMIENARPNHPASMPTTPERKPRTIRMIRHFNARINALYVSTPSAGFQASSGDAGPDTETLLKNVPQTLAYQFGSIDRTRFGLPQPIRLTASDDHDRTDDIEAGADCVRPGDAEFDRQGHAQHRCKHRRDPVGAPEERKQLRVTAPDAQPQRKHHPHAERGGGQQQDREQNAHGGGFRSGPCGEQGSGYPGQNQHGQQGCNPGDDRAQARGMRTDGGAADTAEEKDREQHDTESVDGMSEEDHQSLHLRYLDQHESHADRAEIRDGWRQF